MADIEREVFGVFNKKYQDMGDGTHAEVVAIGGTIPVSGGITQAEVEAALQAAPVPVAIGGTVPVSGGLTQAEVEAALQAAPVPVDGAVEAELTAGETHIGQVGGESITTLGIPTLAVAGLYASGDALGGIMEFGGVGRYTGQCAVLKNLDIVDLTTQEFDIELWLFDRAFTPATDNDPFSVSDEDLAHWVCTITTVNGDWFVSANQSVASVEVSKVVNPNDTSLFGQFVVRGAATYSDGDLIARLSAMQD